MGFVERLVVLAGTAVGWGWNNRKRAVASSTTGSDPHRPAGVVPFVLGDVLVVGGDEAWLAGGLALREADEPFAVVYIAPERRSHRAVVVFAPPRDEVLWLVPAPPPFSGEPPSTIEAGAVIYERSSRRPAKVERCGELVLDLAARATFAEFRGPGRAVLCTLTAGSEALAWQGERVPLLDVERLPGS